MAQQTLVASHFKVTCFNDWYAMHSLSRLDDDLRRQLFGFQSRAQSITMYFKTILSVILTCSLLYAYALPTKKPVFDDHARKSLQRGVDTLSGAVKVTLGPRGMSVYSWMTLT